ncbi:NAD-dependent epimerase/dehydratase family protein [Janthinobacterium sp. 17J80-10]|uniref:NAD-dependent epimerase/dehydratase family protein n=1 Tax=Janthinobacterium sp. 17J80-10 TaxID=2497863 RepID=UPI0010052B34|nr:NAD-dependent epimerase/dehydratase family protein [Janthinobacterium sp. 17J80-10]QAU35399.1 NAD-dependent epimerase/dehydratase family protein [Janthinobacterium sp. 17J80-10]
MSSGSKTILVTGAAGFIGAFVAARLADMGHQVIGCDNFNDYYTPQLKNDRVAALLAPRGIACQRLELADAAEVEQLFAQHRPAMVVHLAAQAGVRYSLQNPAAYIQSNLVAFSHILEACRRHQIEHLLYASSSSVYGANAKVPFSESDRTDEPVSLYAATKKSNELMAYSYSHLYRFPATGLRFFTVYGPWGRPDMAYFSFTQKMLKGEAIPVFAGGELRRDFTYIDDIVEGVVRLLFKPKAPADGGAPHAVFNIGNHQPVRVLDFIQTLEKVLGVKARIDFQPMQPGDVPATYADADALREHVGFAPATALEQGLDRFGAWYRSWAN